MISYLTYLILKGFNLFIGLLPEGFALWMGRQLGNMGYYLDWEHRKVALQNLQVAFGQEKSCLGVCRTSYFCSRLFCGFDAPYRLVCFP